MPNSYIGSSLARENDGITLLVEGVSIQYLQDLKFVAVTVLNDEVTLHFRDSKRNRTKIQLEATAGDKNTWFEMLGEKKLILKDYSNNCIYTQYTDSVFGLSETVVKVIQAINKAEGRDPVKEQAQQLKENLISDRQRRLAGFVE